MRVARRLRRRRRASALRSPRGVLHIAVRPLESEVAARCADRARPRHELRRDGEARRRVVISSTSSPRWARASRSSPSSSRSSRGAAGCKACAPLLHGEGLLRPARSMHGAGAAADRARPPRPDPRPRAPIPAARRQPAHLGPGGAARDAAQRVARQRRASSSPTASPTSTSARRRASALQHPASGLVTALEPVMRACSGTWIAHGSGSADRETVDRHDRVAVPPGHPLYQVRRVVAHAGGGAQATTAVSPTKGCGRCATSRTCARRSARADFEHYRTVNAKFADAVVAEAQDEGSGRPGAGLPLRAVAADDPRSAARRDDHHVLAHPVAESRGVRDLPVAHRAARRPARQQHPRLPHAVPLQQLPRHRRPPDRGARRPRVVHRRVPRRRRRRCTAIRSRSSGRRRRWRPRRASPTRGARCASGSSCRATTSSASASIASTTRKGIIERFNAVARLLEIAAAVDRQLHVRADRRADAAARSTTIATTRRRVRALADGDQRALRGRASIRRSCCSPSITSPMRSTSTIARADVCVVSQPARRDEPRRQGVRRGARRRARRARSCRSSPARRANCRKRSSSIRMTPTSARRRLQRRADDARGRAARPDALHARRRPRVQRLSLGRADAARRRRDAAARALPRGRYHHACMADRGRIRPTAVHRRPSAPRRQRAAVAASASRRMRALPRHRRHAARARADARQRERRRQHLRAAAGRWRIGSAVPSR